MTFLRIGVCMTVPFSREIQKSTTKIARFCVRGCKAGFFVMLFPCKKSENPETQHDISGFLEGLFLFREVKGHAALEHLCRILCRFRTGKMCADLLGDDIVCVLSPQTGQ